MPSSYSNDLRIEEQATGENSATWGTKLNSAISQISDAFSYGTEQLSADANETFTIADGTADAARSLYLKITSAGSLTATRTVTLGPNTVSKIWIIENATTGSQSIAISQGSGANVTVASGATKVVYTDGAGAGAAVTDALVNLALTAPTLTGTAVVASLDISGDIDVDGTTNLDVVDIDGAVDMASTLAVGGTTTITGTDDTPLLINTANTNGPHLRFQVSGSSKHFVGSGGGIALGDADDLAARAFDNLLFATGNSSTERFRIDASGRVGVGGAPNTNWRNDATDDVLMLGTEATLHSDAGVTTELWNNAYVDNADTFKNISTRGATRYFQYDGQHKFYTAASASAGSTITTEIQTTPKMVLDVSGQLGINTTSAKEKLSVTGAAVFDGNHATGTNAYSSAQGVMIHAASSAGFITAVSNGANDVDLQLRALNGGSANANQLVLDSNGDVQFTADSDVRLTIGSEGTVGNNTSNWLRGDETQFRFNNAGGGYLFETSGTATLTTDGSHNATFAAAIDAQNATIGSGATRLKVYSDSTYSGIYNGSSLGSDESLYMGNGKVYVYSDGDTALTIDSSQKATFGGAIQVNGTTGIYNGLSGDIGGISISPSNTNTIISNNSRGSYGDYGMLFRTMKTTGGAAYVDALTLNYDGEIRVAGQTAVKGSNSKYGMVFPDNSGIAIGSAYTFANIYGSSGNVYIRANSYVANTGSNGKVHFQTANSSGGQANDVVIDGGTVLIGHGTDTAISGESNELQVYDTNFSLASFATFRNGSDGATISLAHSRSGTVGTQTVLNDGDIMGAINFVGSDGTDMAHAGAAIRGLVDGTPGSNDMPGKLSFLTTSDGASTPTERMKIGSDGVVETMGDIKPGADVIMANGRGVNFTAASDTGSYETVSSSTLDDYETGTFTGTLEATTTNPTITQGNSFTGQYTKVGNVVTCRAYTGIRTITSAGSGIGKINQLPFVNSNGFYGVVSITHGTMFHTQTGYMESNNSFFYPIAPDSVNGMSYETGSVYMMFSVTYLTG